MTRFYFLVQENIAMEEQRAGTKLLPDLEPPRIRNGMEDSRIRNEMYMRECGEVIAFRHLQKAANASCKIVLDKGTGSGFFIKTMGVYGLMTCNHVIGIDDITDGKSFDIYLHNDERVEILMKKELFCFSCPFLDATFVELDKGAKDKLEYANATYLEAAEGINCSEKIFILQYPAEIDLNELAFADGFIVKISGFSIFHQVTTYYQSSGSMIINKQGLLVGIHRARNPDHKPYPVNIGVNFKLIFQAMETFRMDKNRSLIQGILKSRDEKLLKECDFTFTSVLGLFKIPSLGKWIYNSNHYWYTIGTIPTKIDATLDETLDEVRKWDWVPTLKKNLCDLIGEVKVKPKVKSLE